MPDKFDLTIVVSSFNRNDAIEQTITKLFECDMTSFQAIELLIIDDGSPLPVANVLNRIGSAPEKMDLRLIRQENAGIGATRNRGFREAKADLVLFLDDDILIKPNTLNEFAAAHKFHRGGIIFGSYPFIHHETVALHKFASHFYGYDLITSEPTYEKVNAITSGLLCVDKTKLHGTEKLYRDDLTIPAAEEHEIIYRFDKLGIPIVHARHISATHNHDLDISWIASQQFKYGEATAEAFEKVPGLVEMERFARLKGSLMALNSGGIKGFSKRLLASVPGRRILMMICRIMSKVLPEGDHGTLFGYLTTAYFWAGYLRRNSGNSVNAN